MSPPEEKLLEHWRNMEELRRKFEERWTIDSFSRALRQVGFRRRYSLDVHRSTEILNLLSLLVPRRLAEEEIGDALERIQYLVRLGRPRWHIWLKVAVTSFWVCLNSIREITSAVHGRASAKP